MSHYAVHEEGRIRRTFTLPRGMPLPAEEAGAIPCGPEVTLQTHYVRGGAALPIPASPGAGWVFDYQAGEWAFSEDLAWQLVRADRDARLAACDWRVLPDSPTPDDMRQAWLDYRQALRDVTGQGDPRAIDWPAPPG